MSGADEALDALRAACAPELANVAVAVREASRAQQQFRAADDLLIGMGDAVGLILALEHVANAAKAAHKTARDTLAACMEETGASSLRTDSHTASVSAPRASVVVTDPAAIPPDLFTAPEPAPDKAAIAKRLRAGERVPGVELSNGGAPVLTIRKSED